MLKVNLNQVKILFRKIPTFLAERAFLLFILLIILAALLSFIFGKMTNSKIREPESIEPRSGLNMELLREVKEILAQLELEKKLIEEKNYPNIFR